jgi:hypothetical protein
MSVDFIKFFCGSGEQVCKMWGLQFYRFFLMVLILGGQIYVLVAIANNNNNRRSLRIETFTVAKSTSRVLSKTHFLF